MTLIIDIVHSICFMMMVDVKMQYRDLAEVSQQMKNEHFKRKVIGPWNTI